jgi:hypothetical protein
VTQTKRPPATRGGSVGSTWKGFDETDKVSGDGSAELLDDHSIEIEFAYQRRRSRPQSQTRDFSDTPLGAFYDRFRARNRNWPDL